MTLAEILAALQGKPSGAAQPVRTTPEGGLDLRAILAGAQIGQTQKSPYERTMRPGETRSAGDVQDMLAEVILAAGSGALPGVGPRGQARQAPARVRPGFEKQFEMWFGGSKAVDAQGKPLTLYHGTGAAEPFTSFKTAGGSSPIIQDRLGAHFGTATAANKRLSQAPINAQAESGPRSMPVHLSVKNPLTKQDGTPFSESEMRGVFTRMAKKAGIDPSRRPRDASNAVKQLLMEQGYDGIAYRNSIEDRGSTSFIVFRPEQIKSATGNRGTYDPNSPRIDE